MVSDYKVKTINIDNSQSDKELIKNFPKVLKNKGLGKENDMCYNYALKNKWLDSVEDSVDFVFEYYDMIAFKDLRPGDIVLFKETDNDDTPMGIDFTYLHFGRIIKKGNSIDETIIRAKFGACGIYEHKLKYTPSCYGNRIEFWKERG